jgi:hypothetical protein
MSGVVTTSKCSRRIDSERAACESIRSRKSAGICASKRAKRTETSAIREAVVVMYLPLTRSDDAA